MKNCLFVVICGPNPWSWFRSWNIIIKGDPMSNIFHLSSHELIICPIPTQYVLCPPIAWNLFIFQHLLLSYIDAADIVHLYHHHFAAFRSSGVVMLTYDKEAISRVVTKHGNMGDPRWINFTVPIWSGHSKNKNCWNGCSGSPMGGNSGVVEWMLGRECNRLIKCKPNKGAWEREPPARAG